MADYPDSELANGLTALIATQIASNDYYVAGDVSDTPAGKLKGVLDSELRKRMENMMGGDLAMLTAAYLQNQDIWMIGDYSETPSFKMKGITHLEACKLFKRDGWINVKDYGAKGDGSTNDQTAVYTASQQIPETGGVLYFPPGEYMLTDAIALANPTLIMGCGMGNIPSEPSYGCKGITTINQTINNKGGFIVTAIYAKFQNIAIINSSAYASTSGAGIQTSGADIQQRVDYDSVSVDGFWIDIDVQVGATWTGRSLFIANPQKYGIKIQNTVNNDAGDWAISDSDFYAYSYAADAAIRIESSGGGKITNCKVNCGWNGGTPTSRFGIGIDVNNSSSNAPTMILHIQNTSIENFSVTGINFTIATYFYKNIQIVGVGIGVPTDASGDAITMLSDNVTHLLNVIISDCIFYGKTSGYAISLTKVNMVKGSDNIVETGSFGSGLYTASNCTNVTLS